MNVKSLLIASLIALPAFAAASGPIIGTWRLVVPGTNCVETHTFGKDGVRAYTSAKEKGESRYTLSEKPDTSGYYKFTDIIVKTNGEPDCLGQSSPEGDTIIGFVRFTEPGDTFFLCTSRSQDTCVNELSRVPSAP